MAKSARSATNLKSMTVDRLSKLRAEVETMLVSKVAERRRMIESTLEKLGGFSMERPSSRGPRAGVRGRVAPKYRNPDNPAETWAGRGLRPRWLVAALKSGKKLEHFSIDQPGKASARKTRRKQAKAARKGVGRKGLGRKGPGRKARRKAPVPRVAARARMRARAAAAPSPSPPTAVPTA
jgi:DNA-binding protein H-NS